MLRGGRRGLEEAGIRVPLPAIPEHSHHQNRFTVARKQPSHGKITHGASTLFRRVLACSIDTETGNPYKSWAEPSHTNALQTQYRWRWAVCAANPEVPPAESALSTVEQ
jgi:hypothetical protein